VIPGAQIILPSQANSVWNRNAIGWTTRANFGFDIASNTAYGPLIGHFDINSETGNGFDNTRTATYLNTGYLTWAGITAGKAQSFFSFIGGGDNCANIFSPDRKGFNEPNLIAYTASFGGGFSATLSLESQGSVGNSPSGTNITQGSVTYGGMRWPDIVGTLHYKSGWGEAQLSGVLHNVNVEDTSFYNSASSCGLLLSYCNAREGKVGWGLDAGVKVNLPSFGAGDSFLVTGAYTQSAVWSQPDRLKREPRSESSGVSFWTARGPRAPHAVLRAIFGLRNRRRRLMIVKARRRRAASRVRPGP
jgi:hypothetical protein